MRLLPSDHELHAAGINDPRLQSAYRDCRAIAARQGRTYFLATRLMPPERRPAVHALYALARMADDIVDEPSRAEATSAARLRALATAFRRGDETPGPLLAALHTVDRYGIDRGLFDAFFASMEMDLTTDRYPDFAALAGYVYGSAEVIGLQLLPVLGTVTGAAAAAAVHARQLGAAFQLTNFIRDVGEDLRRGRLYLPMDDLAECRLTVAELRRGVIDHRVRRLLRLQVDRARGLYAQAALGMPLLDPASRDCVAVAWTLYGEILDTVEDTGYQVFDRRVSVGISRRLHVFVPALARALRARERRPHQTHQARVCSVNENPNSRSSTGA